MANNAFLQNTTGSDYTPATILPAYDTGGVTFGIGANLPSGVLEFSADAGTYFVAVSLTIKTTAAASIGAKLTNVTDAVDYTFCNQNMYTNGEERPMNFSALITVTGLNKTIRVETGVTNAVITVEAARSSMVFFQIA